MGFDAQDKEIVRLLTKLKDIDGKYPSDLFLTCFVVWMRFAGIDNLQSAMLRSDSLKAFDIAEKQICALVSRRPSRKTDGKNVAIHSGVGFLINVMK